MADLTETLGRAGLTVAEALEGEADLDALIRAISRETVIRHAVAETGEPREIVATMLDAEISMDQEGVLDLVEGDATTLHAALQRYVSELEGRDELQSRDRLVGELDSLLAYPWPGPELEVERPDDETMIVKVGGELVAGANHDDHGWAGMDAMETTARNVHKATVAYLRRA